MEAEKKEEYYIKADPELIKRQEALENLMDDLALAILQTDGVVTT